MNPPINRLGGKSRLRKQIIELIPEHTCYVEPFFGAGWVFFGKEPSKVEVINDVDRELINLFRVLKYHAPEVERLMEYEFSGRDIFEEYRDESIEYLTDTHRAVRFMYLFTQSFAGKGGTYGYGVTSKPNPKIFYQEWLGEIKDRLKNTYVENRSFEKIIPVYDRENTFFFCDPPYIDTTGYGNEFGEKEHEQLRNLLKDIKGKFLVTINDCEKSRELYKDFKIKETEVSYSVCKDENARGKYKELIICNY